MDTKAILNATLIDYPIHGQVVSEIERLLAYLSLEATHQNFLEIGTQYGFTFALFAKMYSGKKISVDLPNGLFGGLDLSSSNTRNAKLTQAHSGCFFLATDSTHKDTLATIVGFLGDEQLDLLFIDGNHTFEGVKTDYEMYSPLVKKGGLIVFHDIKQPERYNIEGCFVSKFYETLSAPKTEFLDPLVEWGGLGVIRKE